MKKIILCIVLAFSSYTSAQVGIGTNDPKATLDISVNEIEPITTSAGLLIPRVSRALAQNITITPEESTLIYINNLNGMQDGAASQIDAKGFYYYSSSQSKWIKIYNNQSNPIDLKNYTFNNGLKVDTETTENTTNVKLGGVLTEPTIIMTKEANKLAINVEDSSDEVDNTNMFSVDDVFSVDGTNNRIGIGTITPENTLDVKGNIQFTGSLNVADNNPGDEGQILVSQGPGYPPVWLNRSNDDGSVNPIISVNAENGLSYDENPDGTSVITLGGTLNKSTEIITSKANTSTGVTDNGLKIGGDSTKALLVGNNYLLVNNNSGNIGIGVASPTRRLHINNGTTVGAIRIEDTTEGSGKVLTSNSIGVGTWESIKTEAENGLESITASNSNNTTITLGGDLIKPITIIRTNGVTNKLAISGLSNGDSNTDNILTIDGDNVIKKVSRNNFDLTIPKPTVLYLKEDISNFLFTSGLGSRNYIALEKGINSIDNLIIDNSTPNKTIIEFPPGVYQITLVYEVDSPTSIANCTISSYFVDFPYKGFNPNGIGNDVSNTNNTNRVHSTASHKTGRNSNHGGNISYTFSNNNTVRWGVNLGRGQSGDCAGQEGFVLEDGSTQLTILRLGDSEGNNFPIP